MMPNSTNTDLMVPAGRLPVRLQSGTAQAADTRTVRLGLPPDGNNVPGETSSAASPATPEEGLAQALKSIEKQVQALHRELQFSIDDTSGRTVIKVVDAETKQIIRQIPPEEVLDFARRLDDGKGALFEMLA
jgi:flagellar protein FlaG